MYLCTKIRYNMQIKSAEFSGSSSHVSQKPKAKKPEFAFIGRSNVGKSSLINYLCNNAKLAKTSATPGKTQLVNHFLVNGEWYLVDLPGYGFAKLSQKGREKLDQMIRGYITASEELVLLFVLVDSRHDLQKSDLEFMLWLGENGIPFSIIFTKTDKLSQKKVNENIKRISEELLNYWEELPPVFKTSSEKKTGAEELLGYIENILNTL